jgi:hypothetical protein
MIEEMMPELDSEYTTSLVEIGSYCGESSVIFAILFDKVYCIDPWRGGYDSNDGTSYANMEEVYENFYFLVRNFNNIRHYRVSSKEASEFNSWVIPEKVNVVYIDGCHQYESVKEDIELWLPRVTHFIAGHDYTAPGVQKALKEKFDLSKINTYSDNSWSLRV